jgi:hypothetical protein
MNIVEQENEAVLSCGLLHHAHSRAEEMGMSAILHKHHLGRVSKRYEQRTERAI